MLRAGQVLWGPYPIGERKERPIIVLTDEDPKTGLVVVCTSTDLGIFADRTTLLQARCHSDITRECVVVYEEATIIEDGSGFGRLIANGTFRLSSQVLDRGILIQVQKGAAISSFTPRSVVNRMQSLGLL